MTSAASPGSAFASSASGNNCNAKLFFPRPAAISCCTASGMCENTLCIMHAFGSCMQGCKVSAPQDGNAFRTAHAVPEACNALHNAGPKPSGSPESSVSLTIPFRSSTNSTFFSSRFTCSCSTCSCFTCSCFSCFTWLPCSSFGSCFSCSCSSFGSFFTFAANHWFNGACCFFGGPPPSKDPLG